MPPSLRYLLIIQPGGIPLFSQSFDFYSDNACQTFNERLSSEKSILFGGFFDAIKGLFSEVIDDSLKLIDVGLVSFRVTGLVYHELLFVGIFEHDTKKEFEEAKEFLVTLGDIAALFVTNYPNVVDEVARFDVSQYSSFSKDLADMGFPLELQDCRNCLEKCSDENKECMPHLFYYDDLKIPTG